MTLQELLLRDIAEAARRQILENRLREEYDIKLTYPQAIALLILGRDVSMQTGELAATIGCARGNVTGIVDRLVRSGYVVRQDSEEDRRVILLKVTDAGYAILPKIHYVFGIA